MKSFSSENLQCLTGCLEDTVFLWNKIKQNVIMVFTKYNLKWEMVVILIILWIVTDTKEHRIYLLKDIKLH